jgi:putative oxidoreductase
MKKFLQLGFLPSSTDLGLLLLRVWLGISLFVMHGIEKIFHFHDMLLKPFPDPLHFGAVLSLAFALLSDGICSLLILFGLFTRFASLFIVINLLVVFIFMHGFSFYQDHGQLVYVYLGGYLAILVAGAGKYSIDKVISK